MESQINSLEKRIEKMQERFNTPRDQGGRAGTPGPRPTAFSRSALSVLLTSTVSEPSPPGLQGPSQLSLHEGLFMAHHPMNSGDAPQSPPEQTKAMQIEGPLDGFQGAHILVPQRPSR